MHGKGNSCIKYIGALNYANKDKYEGKFKDNKKEGKGIMEIISRYLLFCRWREI